MTPRDAAIQAYADAERRELLRAHAARRLSPLIAFRHRETARKWHRAMENELYDPEPIGLRRRRKAA